MVELRSELDSLANPLKGSDTARDPARTDSLYRVITHTTLRHYLWSAVEYEFALAYMFFQPATTDIRAFLRLPIIPTGREFIGSTRNVSERQLSRLRSPVNWVISLISLASSAALLVGLGLSLMLLRKPNFRPVVLPIAGWVAYTVILIGPLAQARYRVTFTWALCISIGLALHWIREHRTVHRGLE